MDALAPPVVAVIVTRDPGPWFEEALRSFGAQDYPELSVLVLDAASTEDPTERVAATLPSAFVRRFEANPGFGATADEVRSMVDGAAYFLFCHDDVAPDPDAVHLLVEESFRSNAAIVSPKFVSWGDPERLLHVGLAADKVGSVEDRVHPDEVDHGQHDAVRDVFVAPGGCTLVRADLFGDLGGFDPTISFLGEDLDLCWRAQVVGARVVVAPQARVRHREELASGSRDLPGPDPDDAGAGDADRPVTLQELQRRHELYVVLKCYGRWHRWRVLPQAFLLAVGEVIVAELAGNRARARAVRRAWNWNVRHRSVIRERRSELQANRHLPDREVRALQVGGSARMAAYGRRVFEYGFHGAHADELAADETPAARDGGDTVATGVAVAAGVTIAPAPPAGGPGVQPTSRSADAAPGRVRLLVWLGVALVLVFGTRDVLLSQLPAVGQFAPFPSYSAAFTQFIAGWHPSGVGTTAPAAPAFALLTLGGTVVLGAMGLLQHLLVFAPVPIGAWGTVRLVRRFGSPRAAFVAGLAYLAMPLAYDGVAMGRWGALLAFGGMPWAMDLVFSASSLTPFDRPEPAAAVDGSRWRRLSEPFRGRGSRVRSIVVLGLLEAFLISFVPAAAVALLVVPIALLVAAALVGGAAGARRALVAVVASTGVAVVLTLPWTVGVVSAGRGALVVFGVATPQSTAPTWSDLLRFAPGPIGDSVLAWGFVVAGLLPLLIGRGDRFAWAARCWAVALLSWLVAMVTSHGWLGSLAPDPTVLLVPAAVAVSAAIGLGIAAFETDLRAASFGWRQAATVLAAGLAVLGGVPVVVSAFPGRWNLPTSDFNQTTSWMAQAAGPGSFRVLWLGDPRAVNAGSWPAGDGLAYATSGDGPPDAVWLWNGASPGPAVTLSDAVNAARSGRTDRLGALLAPAGVRYVAVVTALAPVVPGVQTPVALPVPADLEPALAQQLDLRPVFSQSGITVYENASWVPVRSSSPAASPGQVLGVLAGGPTARSYSGPVPAGTVTAAMAPAGRWTLSSSTGSATPAPTNPTWAAGFRVSATGTAALRFDGGPWPAVAVAYDLVVWLAVLVLLLSVRRVRGQWFDRARRRAHRQAASARRNEHDGHVDWDPDLDSEPAGGAT